MSEFVAWPKTPRLFRDITITEKIDGTNAAVRFTPGMECSLYAFESLPHGNDVCWIDGRVWHIGAQSRKRLIYPDADNFGFARWVFGNAAELISLLGEGLHFGEWWGQGIQRGYDVGRRFSLFNTDKFGHLKGNFVGGVRVGAVPVLYKGPFSTDAIENALVDLSFYGSQAAPGFANPEGVCVFHHASRQIFKVTLDDNDANKWEVKS
ncbi:RNA ligase family protein [Allostreptomyces psammosilenae]|uniref:RNA ligase domain-containing protein n=1 Tax=Allostreptomyces psammosilenae TaxID=1892865 RepID=A0A853A6I0_9ACTN|nr:RNA ligase family protein [Allostreptomyces psammosilenae]NYI06082.1 hypothetical protein [Allostreptomyces psammosilenae]